MADLTPYVYKIIDFVGETLMRAEDKKVTEFENHLVLPIEGTKSVIKFDYGTFGNPQYELTFGFEIENLAGDDSSDMEGDFTRDNYKLELYTEITQFISNWNLHSRLKPLK